jgi:hypothetical protein
MAKKKAEATEGVAIRVKNAPDRREAGVPVAAPTNVSEQSESKSGQSAASTKEK